MRKNILLASLFAASATFATAAMADVHFEFSLPFTLNNPNGVSGLTGVATALSLDVDSSTALGIYAEQMNYSDTINAAAGTASSYNIQAFHFTKSINDTVNVGLNLGNLTQTVAANFTGTVADVYGTARLLSTKGKINSYLDTGMKFRMAKTNAAGTAGTAANNLGGLQFTIGAGLNF